MSDQARLQWEILLTLDIPRTGLTTYEAKDPDTWYQPPGTPQHKTNS